MKIQLGRLSFIALTVGVASLAACGGGGGSDSTTASTPAAPPSASAPAPASAPASGAAVKGKSLYQAHCASCHGGDPTRNRSKILRATNPGNTLNAIARNVGGMGYLNRTIGASEASDIAAYLKTPNI